MAGQKDRNELQALFKTGNKPSEEDFRDLIDSVLNLNDDGLEKPPGVETPLKILAHGEAENLLDFYAGERHTWRLNQKPVGANPGFNFEAGGASKLFVECSTGNLGLNTTQPTAKVHIQQSSGQDALRLDAAAENTTSLIVKADGKVGIGKANPVKLLDVNGEVAIAGSLSVAQTSTLQGNLGIGTSPGGGNLKLNVAGNTALSGALSVAQTSHLTGNVGIGAAPGAEKLKVGGTLSVSHTSALMGNVGVGVGADKTHKLTVYGGELALKVDNNENSQGLVFQNSGGAYTWRIYREDIGNNIADLKIAGGANANYTALTDYIRIQNNGNTTFSKNLSVSGALSAAGAASFSGNISVKGKLEVPGDQQIVFTNTNTQNHLKLQLWGGYGLGINSSTLFYAANGKHSWRDANGSNERMSLTTSANGGLTVKGSGKSSFSGNLGVGTTDPSHKFHVLTKDAVGLFESSGTQAYLRLSTKEGFDKRVEVCNRSGGRLSLWTGSDVVNVTRDGKVGIGTTAPSEKLTIKDGDVKIEGGRYRRLKIVSDKYWAGIELVAREKGEAGNPHIDFTHGDLDNPNYGVRLYAPNNNSLLIQGGTLGFVDNDYKPFQLKKFTGSDNPRINTGYSSADWIVIIAGFKVDGKDNSRAQYTYPYVQNNKWWIAADVAGTQDKGWEINILAIRTSWVRVISKI
ncbi:MAG: hypothetical protein QNJ46_09265 [Leptolyngbyaceae cyanobacterium MO_188.B28]|nr:hypothetical protein [Leptolyngbyaceae cyanobacterium MO_188.B28]